MSCFQKHTIFVVTLVLLLPDLFGQVDTNAFRKYNIYDGLANNTVTSIIQDKKGFMWFGTQNGLSKYDGYEFSNYYHDDNDSLSLSDNDINTLFLDSDNNLWVGTMNGLCKYNSKKDNFTIFKYKERISSISNDVITSICEDTSSSLWIGTINGLNKINHKTSEITCFYHNEQKQNSISSSKINTLYLDSKNNLWIGTRDAGLNKLIKKKNGYQFETHNLKATFTEGWSEKNIYSICEDKKGNFWIGTYGGGIFYYDPENKNIIKHFTHTPFNKSSLSNNLARIVFVDSNNQLWVGVDIGTLNLLTNKNKNKFIHIHPSYQSKNTFQAKSTISIYENKQDILWFGTKESGVVKYDPKKKEFKHINNYGSENRRLNHYDVKSIYSYKDSIVWVGMDEGNLTKFNIKTQKTIHYKWAELQNINCIKAENNHIWIGSQDGLGKFNTQTNEIDIIRFSHIFRDKKNTIQSLLIENNTLWLGTANGLRYYNPDIDSSLLLTPPAIGVLEKTKGYNFTSIAKDKKGNIWLNNMDHLLRYNKNSRHFKRYFIEDKKNEIIINDFFQKGDSLWLATSKGLYCFNIINKTFSLPTNSEDIQSINIQSIIFDKKNNLWLSTYNNIIKMIRESNILYHLNSREYFNNIDYNTGCSFINKDGYIFWGGKNGLNYFHPDSISIDTTSKSLVITGFRIFNKKIEPSDDAPLKKHITEANIIELGYKHKIFTFEFALLNYKNPEKNRYAYIMEGIDKDWNHVGNNRTATYTHIPAGEYVFKIKAADENGIWYEGQEVVIKMKPPFWQTFLFKLFMGLIIIGLAIFLYRYRIKRIEKTNKRLNEEVKKRTFELHVQKEELKRLNTSKDKLFSIIGHDLKNPFHAIKSLTNLLNTSYDSLEETRKHEIIQLIDNSSDNAVELLENLLQWSKSNTNNIKFQPEEININQIVKKNIELYRLAAKNKDIKLFTEHKDIKLRADKNMIDTIIRNMISNAIKFSEPGDEIRIEYKETTDKTIISVIDTGIGMNKETRESLFNIKTHKTTQGTAGEAGSGLGLILVHEFVEKHNGTIEIESEVGKGTSFHISIPNHN